MAYVYMLSDYGEDGAEHVVATLDRAKLASMIETNWPTPDDAAPHKQEAYKALRDEAIAKLAELLAQSDEDIARPRSEYDITPGKHNLSFGWGGIQLHVMKLVE